MPKQEHLKLPAILEELAMSRSAFYRMVSRGQGPKLLKLPNGHIRVRRIDLDAWWAGLEQDAA
ncbi:helix-turn-helix transcriptional regulator [Kitasatospora sp. NBC_00315]|uniref:helix-turn-helix transcriptional regulator n=1 Tax=Kitasatospora sp. NBC_00315 TaxID=2975963 RepID=UPI00324B6CDD